MDELISPKEIEKYRHDQIDQSVEWDIEGLLKAQALHDKQYYNAQPLEGELVKIPDRLQDYGEDEHIWNEAVEAQALHDKQRERERIEAIFREIEKLSLHARFEGTAQMRFWKMTEGEWQALKARHLNDQRP